MISSPLLSKLGQLRGIFSPECCVSGHPTQWPNSWPSSGKAVRRISFFFFFLPLVLFLFLFLSLSLFFSFFSCTSLLSKAVLISLTPLQFQLSWDTPYGLWLLSMFNKFRQRGATMSMKPHPELLVCWEPPLMAPTKCLVC